MAFIYTPGSLTEQCLEIINRSDIALTPVEVFGRLDHTKLLGREAEGTYAREHVFRRLLYLAKRGKIRRVEFGLYVRNDHPGLKEGA